MITAEKLMKRMEYVRQRCSSTLSQLPNYQDKTLGKILEIVKMATRNQLLAYEPNGIVTCTLQLLFYYDQNRSPVDNICEWKRRKKSRLAKECYYSLLKTYIPERSEELIATVLDVIYKDKLWRFETFCFEIICSLVEYGVNGATLIHVVWDKVETSNTDVEDTRGMIRILYEFLDIYIWPETHDTVIVIERILNLFYVHITMQSADSSTLYAMLKKGLEVCIRNTVKNLSNDHLLVVVQHMCSWAIEDGMTDEIILEFGSTLEYTAYMHKVTLYEKTLTPKIFPLLMQMIASRSKIISLLGNRVMQYLLDRNGNKMNFDTPKIFFENTQSDLNIGKCHKEDVLFWKLHREILHDSLLKSIMNHCTSRMNLETTYCTICLIAIEVPCGFTAAALVCLMMNIQDLTLRQKKDNSEANYHIHATVIAIMSFLCWIHKAKVFYEYVNKIMIERAQWAPHLNPPIQSQYSFAVHHIIWNKPDLFFVDWEARYGLWNCFRLNEGEEIM